MTCNRIWAAIALLALTAGPLTAATRPIAGVDKIDSRLVSRMVASPSEVVPAWVTFADKGERSPGDLAARLERAERELTPRARARRIRAGVTPLVDVLDLPVDAAYLDGLRAQGFQPYAVSRWMNRAAVRVPAGDLARLAALPSVARITPVARATVIHDPTPATLEQARRSLSSGLGAAALTSIDYGNSLDEVQQLDMVAVHDSGYVGQGVLICMLDDGFYYKDVHEATKDIDVPPGMRRDFVDGDTVVTDPSVGTHGEMTLSCIGANKPGGLIGTAYGATFALARTEVDASETPVEMTNWGLGAEWADSLGADVISSSLGYFDFDAPYPSYTYADMNGHTTDVTRYAEIAAAKGILVCNSAGNEGSTAWHYVIAPADANGDSVISLGGVTSTGTLSSFSSRGPTSDGRIKPDLCARGSSASVVSTASPTSYATASGTSFSCPLSAGVAACILGARPTWRPVDVIKALKLTASRASHPDTLYGWGIIDGLKALQIVPTWLLGTPDSGGRGFGIALLGANPQRTGTSRVRFSVGGGDAGGTAAATVRVVDVTGRTLRTLWSGRALHGSAVDAAWDGTDGAGRRVQPGVYWIALASAGHTASVRLVRL